MAKPEISIAVDLNNLPQIAAKMPEAAGQVIKKAVFDTEARWKSGVRVDTGRYKNSITGRMTGQMSGEVTTDVEYAIPNEYGTKHMAPRPALEEAVALTEADIKAAAAELLKYIAS